MKKTYFPYFQIAGSIFNIDIRGLPIEMLYNAFDVPADKKYVEGHYTAANHVNLSTELNSLYVYCDLIESQMVGDTLVPLLRIVHVNDDDPTRVTKTYERPYYIPVEQKLLQSIEIDIRDCFGRAIRFTSGDHVVAVLHFRPSSI